MSRPLDSDSDVHSIVVAGDATATFDGLYCRNGERWVASDGRVLTCEDQHWCIRSAGVELRSCGPHLIAGTSLWEQHVAGEWIAEKVTVTPRTHSADKLHEEACVVRIQCLWRGVRARRKYLDLLQAQRARLRHARLMARLTQEVAGPERGRRNLPPMETARRRVLRKSTKVEAQLSLERERERRRILEELNDAALKYQSLLEAPPPHQPSPPPSHPADLLPSPTSLPSPRPIRGGRRATLTTMMKRAEAEAKKQRWEAAQAFTTSPKKWDALDSDKHCVDLVEASRTTFAVEMVEMQRRMEESYKVKLWHKQYDQGLAGGGRTPTRAHPNPDRLLGKYLECQGKGVPSARPVATNLPPVEQALWERRLRKKQDEMRAREVEEVAAAVLQQKVQSVSTQEWRGRLRIRDRWMDGLHDMQAMWWEHWGGLLEDVEEDERSKRRVLQEESMKVIEELEQQCLAALADTGDDDLLGDIPPVADLVESDEVRSFAMHVGLCWSPLCNMWEMASVWTVLAAAVLISKGEAMPVEPLPSQTEAQAPLTRPSSGRPPRHRPSSARVQSLVVQLPTPWRVSVGAVAAVALCGAALSALSGGKAPMGRSWLLFGRVPRPPSGSSLPSWERRRLQRCIRDDPVVRLQLQKHPDRSDCA